MRSLAPHYLQLRATRCLVAASRQARHSCETLGIDNMTPPREDLVAETFG